VTAASIAASQYRFAMHLLHEAAEQPEVLTCSSVEGTGLERIWTLIGDRMRGAEQSGAMAAKRAEQATAWMWTLVDEKIRETLRQTEAIRVIAENAEHQVRGGTMTPVIGAGAIVGALRLSGVKP
jgi:LAO/AO transport system kinase